MSDDDQAVALGHRISKLVEGLGGPTSASRMTGIPVPTIKSWAAGASVPNVLGLSRLAAAASVSVDSLLGVAPHAPTPSDRLMASLTGASPRIIQATREVAEQAHIKKIRAAGAPALTGNPHMVKLYDVRASAGPGQLVFDEREKTPVPFDADFLRSISPTPDDLFAIYVQGDSMTPTLEDGDLTLIDKGQRAGDTVMLLRYDNELMIKRVQRLGGGRLLLRSDNSAYRELELEPAAGDIDFEILGRAVWAGRRIR